MGRTNTRAVRFLATVLVLATMGITRPGSTDATTDATASAVVESVPQAAYVPGPDAQSVDRLYAAYFLRQPDPDGIAYWRAQQAGGVSLQIISDAFGDSTEFKTRYGSLDDAGFVDLVYRNVLGRSPDATGLAHWIGVLRRPMSRGAVMLGFSDSAEFKRKVQSATGGDGTTSTTDPAETAIEGVSYAFSKVVDGLPVQWKPCRDIGVVVNFAGAPAGAATALDNALTELSEAMQIRWVLEGTTDERADTTAWDRAYTDPARYGDRFSPVLVSWAETWDGPSGTIGYGGFASYRGPEDGRMYAVTGQVILRQGVGTDAATLENLLLHELGHVANLNHVSSADQVMYPMILGFPDLQYGDKAGFREVGGWEVSCGSHAASVDEVPSELEGTMAPMTGVLDAADHLADDEDHDH